MAQPTSRIAAFLECRIHELRTQQTEAEIAEAAGFRSQNIISQLKSGTVKLPLDHVESLALALDVDPGEIMPLALEQFFDRGVIEMILRYGGGSGRAQ